MIKKSLIGLAVLTATVLSSTASAEDSKVVGVRPYVSFKAGAGFQDLDARCHDETSGTTKTVYDCGLDHKTVFNMRPAIGLQFAGESYVGGRVEVEWYNTNRAKFINDVLIPAGTDEETGEQLYAPGYERNKIQSQAVMFNTYADFYTSELFTPYVGLGLGWAKHSNKYSLYSYATEDGSKYTLRSGKTTTNRLAASASAGTAINFNEHFALDLGATYYYLGTIKNPTTEYKQVLNSFNLDAGLRVSF